MTALGEPATLAPRCGRVRVRACCTPSCPLAFALVGDQRLEIMNVAFAANVPHNAALGLEMLSVAAGEVEMRMPWSAELVGNPETGVLHGGAVTSLVDAACGAAVFLAVVP